MRVGQGRVVLLMRWRVNSLTPPRLSSSVVVGVGAGSNVLMYFFKWVESEHGGKGGKRWVDKHVHTFVNIAGESARTGSEAVR